MSYKRPAKPASKNDSDNDDEDDDYVPYVPLKQRRQQKFQEIDKKLKGLTGDEGDDDMSGSNRQQQSNKDLKNQDSSNNKTGTTTTSVSATDNSNIANNNNSSTTQIANSESESKLLQFQNSSAIQRSLLAQSAEIREREEKERAATNTEDYQKKKIEEEERIIAEQLRGKRLALKSAKQNAQGTVDINDKFNDTNNSNGNQKVLTEEQERDRRLHEYWNTPLPPIGWWRPPKKLRMWGQSERDKILDEFQIECAGPTVDMMSVMRMALRGQQQLQANKTVTSNGNGLNSQQNNNKTQNLDDFLFCQEVPLPGDHLLPPPIKKFKDMRLPKGILRALEGKQIQRPTQIQMMALPLALSGRDLIGCSFTGSGKTMIFLIPMVLRAIEIELQSPTQPGEGPYGLMLSPSRELASQTHKNLIYLMSHMELDETCELWKRIQRKNYQRGIQNKGQQNYFMDQYNNPGPLGSLTTTSQFDYANPPSPQLLRSVLLTGGIAAGNQLREIEKGVHCCIATPGRLNHLLNNKQMHLTQCCYLALDEADRMVDSSAGGSSGFEEELRITLDHLGKGERQRQTILVSATMPRKILEFASSMLVKPVVVNVGKVGTANRDILQDVEHVAPTEKHKATLEALKKTQPPVLIFCEGKSECDDLLEYLLLKQVNACAVHGGLDQSERLEAIEAFKREDKDVLIGTDVASKGLDFPKIEHVINIDLPRNIEDYIHRIGRTGRRGCKGVSTTFINRTQCEDRVLLDLKAVLTEAKQVIHPLLQQVEDEVAQSTGASGPLNLQAIAETDIGGIKGCIFCGGLGHRVATCPKLESTERAVQASKKDVLVSGSRYGKETAGYGGDW